MKRYEYTLDDIARYGAPMSDESLRAVKRRFAEGTAFSRRRQRSYLRAAAPAAAFAAVLAVGTLFLYGILAANRDADLAASCGSATSAQISEIAPIFNATAVAPPQMTPAEIEQAIRDQARAAEASDLLPGRRMIWLDGRYLYVGFTENDTEDAKARVRERLADYLDVVVFETIRYSYQELTRAGRIAATALGEAGYSVAIGVDERENAAHLSFCFPTTEEARDYFDCAENRAKVTAILAELVATNQSLIDDGIELDVFHISAMSFDVPNLSFT
jgi:hypothetical protein